jgi:hypothetical protein
MGRLDAQCIEAVFFVGLLSERSVNGRLEVKDKARCCSAFFSTRSTWRDSLG